MTTATDVPASAFYVTGGTLERDAPCYVTRKADEELFESLTRGRFCYVLTARQMGKSSLMVRTVWRLRQSGTRAVALDLTALGRSVSVEQWYRGLLDRVGRQLGIEPELEAFWDDHSHLSPLQRWVVAITDFILPCEPRPLVIFVDEIDAVRSLPFSTDELFAAIREIYNRRALEPDLARLSFCLLGVASPSDLIRDTRTTPFNIGKRIELRDFTEGEASPLTKGFSRNGVSGEKALRRILYWTGGHPYLTQKTCQEVTESEKSVDAICGELFLTRRAREEDDNLIFVRERMLRSEVDLAALLQLYEKVYRGERVVDDDANPLVSVLRLSGIAQAEEGILQVRNRIYQSVFDRAWVRENMPGAELRRQKAAYRKGLLRAGAAAAVVVAVVGSLAVVALQQRNRAVQQQRENRRLLYTAQTNLAYQNWETGYVNKVEDYLRAQIPRPGEEDLRTFEWYYLWRLCCQDPSALRHTDAVWNVVFSPDGKILAGGSRDGTIKLWDMASRRPFATLGGHKGRVTNAFSADGKLLISGGMDGTLRFWDLETHKELRKHNTHGVKSLAISRDGRLLVTGSMDRSILVWNLTSGRVETTLTADAPVLSLALSPDGGTLATGAPIKEVKIWSLAQKKILRSLAQTNSWARALAFSPDGRVLAVGGALPKVTLFDVASGRELLSVSQPFDVGSIAFSPDGGKFAVVGAEATAKIFNSRNGRHIAAFRGSRDQLSSAAFSPDGTTLAVGGHDKTVKLWDVASLESVAAPGHMVEDAKLAAGYLELARWSGQRFVSLAFSPDGGRLAAATYEGTVGVWDVASATALARFRGHDAPTVVEFSPDGKLLLTAGRYETAKIWDVETAQLLHTLERDGQAVWGIAFSPDGLAATGGSDGTVTFWRTDNGREQMRIQAQGESSFIAISPDGRTMATAALDYSLKLWELPHARERASLGPLESTVQGIAFSEDGKRLFTSVNRVVKVWDVATAREIAELTLGANIRRLALSPDGRTLATGGDDNLVRLSNVATRQEVLALKGHTGSVSGVAFSPDGRRLASGSTDGTIRLWRAATKEEVAAQLRTQ